MYCPQCGQQIASEEMRFCKQCGFGIDGVKDLLAPSVPVKVSPPGLLNIHVGADPRSLRGLNQAAYLLLLAFVPVLLAIAQGVFSFNLLAPLLLIKAFFVLLAIAGLRFCYSVYEARQEWKPPKRSQIGAHKPELEIQQNDSPPAAFIAERVNTTEIVRPPSITERTTKLLSKSEENR